MPDPRNVFVTGGAGYVGSHACKALRQSGFQPIAYDNLSAGHKEAVKWGPLITGDLHDVKALTAALREYHPCAVIHFAAHIFAGESVENPLKYYENNVGGTLSLLAAMRMADVSRLVFSSSCAVYGAPAMPLITEDCERRPVNPYGHSKFMVENILADLAGNKKFGYAALRYFNAAGADPDCEIGEQHDPEPHLIPLAIRAALGGPPLKIFGSDFPTPDGTAIRDYTHVSDLAAAHVLALNHVLAGKESGCFNLGTGTGHSVLKIIENLRLLGLDVPAEKTARRTGDSPQLVADVSKAKHVLGWHASLSSIEKILSTAIAWYRRSPT